LPKKQFLFLLSVALPVFKAKKLNLNLNLNHRRIGTTVLAESSDQPSKPKAIVTQEPKHGIEK
jgi:hypothetical protein